MKTNWFLFKILIHVRVINNFWCNIWYFYRNNLFVMWWYKIRLCWIYFACCRNTCLKSFFYKWDHVFGLNHYKCRSRKRHPDMTGPRTLDMKQTKLFLFMQKEFFTGIKWKHLLELDENIYYVRYSFKLNNKWCMEIISEPVFYNDLTQSLANKYHYFWQKVLNISNTWETYGLHWDWYSKHCYRNLKLTLIKN